MLASISSRRLGTAALAAVLAGGGLLAAPAPSQAAVLGIAQTAAIVDFEDDPTGTLCTQTGPGDVSNVPLNFAADGVPVTSTANSSAVITDNNNATDKTTMSANITHTVTATQAGGQLSHVHLTSTASTSLATAIAATKCGASVLAGGQTEFQFDLVAPTLVTITAEAHRMVGIVEAGNITGTPDDLQAVVAYAIGGHGTSTSTALLNPGTALVGINQSQAAMEAPAAASTKSVSGDVTVDISFDVPGAASIAQAGSGGKYVTLGAGRSCSAGTLPMTWTKKAGSGKKRVIKKAVVTVNGAKVATIKKPKKNQVTTLTGLNAEKAAAVEVSFKIKGKGKFTVDKSYLRCS
jgi:hypothetical protein